MTLTELQSKVRDHIAANLWFADVPVIIESAGDFETELEIALQKLGLCIVVATPASVVKERGVQPYLTVQVVVAIAETPTVNQTGRHAGEALDRLIPLLHRMPLGGAGAGCLYFAAHDAEDIPGMAAYRIRFEANIVSTTPTTT
jgi:hypothetical protein